MFRRNFDFFALSIVLIGLAVIQHAPRVPRQVAGRTIALQSRIGNQTCKFDRIVARLSRLRSE